MATHELGHSIGMGDLYTLPDGDPRKSDYAQVMNSYDAPQRTLGNGDRTGAQTLYGVYRASNKDAIGVFRPSERRWYLDYNNDGYVDAAPYFGSNGDIPVAGDWAGNGKDTLGVFRPSERRWYLDYNNDGYVDVAPYFGLNGDVPVSGDW